MNASLVLSVVLAGLQTPTLPEDAIFRLQGHSDGVASVSWSPDGRYVLSASRDQTLALWDASTGKRVRVYTGHEGGVRAACFLPDGRRFVSCSEDKTLILWETETGRQERVFKGHTIGVRCLAISPDGLQMLSGSGDKSFIHWDLRTGEVIRSYPNQGGWVLSLAFSADGRKALAANLDRSLSLFDLEKGALLKRFVGHTDNVWSVAFSPENRKALTAGGDAILNLWDITTGELLHTFEGHSRGVYSAAISLDGRSIVSGSKDKTVAVWDLARGKVVRSLKGHEWEVTSVAFSPGGRLLASGSEDGTVILWNAHQAQARAADAWEKERLAQPEDARKKALADLLPKLGRADLAEVAQIQERLIRAGGDGVREILEAYPPRPGSAISEERLKQLLVDLDNDDFTVRVKAQKEIRSAGSLIIPWMEKQLREGKDLSAEVRGSLKGLLQDARSVVMDLGDLGMVRAVLSLIEMRPSPEAGEALARYAQGPAVSYAAVLARRALGK